MLSFRRSVPLTPESYFSSRFHFKANRKRIGYSIVILKNGTRDFQNTPPFKISACFHVTISGNFERFQNFNLKIDFLKNKNLFKYSFLVKSTKIENAPFPYKTAISEANVKTIECWVQNGPITKNGLLPVTTLFFWKFCFSLSTNYPNTHTFCKRWSFIWWCFFPVSILKFTCWH